MNKNFEKIRRKHIKRGHGIDNSIRIDKMRSEMHPHSDKEFIFTVNIMLCNECGLIWLDSGLEFRKPPFERKAPPHE
jgi:hypothetical protein